MFFGMSVLAVIGMLAVLRWLLFPFIEIHAPPPLDRPFFLLPFGVIGFVVLMSAIFTAVRSLRRMSMPLDDLLHASDRVAEGDYSARVDEKGPPEIRSVTRAFNSMAARLQVANEQRRNMLADVTHELRSPLTIIQGHVEGMLDGVYAPDQNRLNFILEETHILSRLVEDLRTLSLAQTGALQLKKEQVDPAALLREIVAAFGSQAGLAGVQLELTAAPELPLLNVDAARIREVLSNLITNAVRYTPAGGAIRIRAEPEPGGGVRFTVSDDGPGIPSEDLPHVFERFYKSSDSGGMGLGLSIAKYLVEAHGGRINAESGTGRGATISFVLPA
jgi:two-component system OmpR family sensor kinase/two-component system sensor histidine kinase BaeS